MTTIDTFQISERLTYPDDWTWERKRPENWGSTVHTAHKIEREITYNNFLFFKLRKEYCKSFLSWSIVVVCKTGFISWNVTEKYTFIDGWVSKRKELPITDGPKEHHFNLQILC